MLKNIMGRLSFAHFGAANAKPAAESGSEGEGEEMKHADTEECEDEEMSAETSETEDGEGADAKSKKKSGKKSKKSKKKTGDDNSGSDEDEDEDEDGETDDDEGESDEHGKKAASTAFARGKRAERKRVTAVLSNPACGRNPELACKLLCTSDMEAGAIVAILESQPPSRGALGRRMESAAIPKTTAGGAPDVTTETAIANSWETAMKKAGG